MSTTVQRIDVLETYAALRAHMETLRHHLLTVDGHLPAWTPADDEEGSARQLISDHITQLWYDAETPVRCPGLVSASPATLSVVAELNGIKAEFETLMIALRQQHNKKGAKLIQLLGTAEGHRDDNIKELLDTARMTGINLTACYRRLQILPETTEAISWTWDRGSSSFKRLSVSEAMDYAQTRLKDQDVQLPLALDYLAQLDPTETVVIARPVQPILKANLCYHDESEGVLRRPVQAHSPLFLVYEPNRELRTRWPGYLSDNLPPRLKRSDRVLNDEPAIASLHLYRYRSS